MKTILFIGNGFNRLLASLVRNYPADKTPKDLKTDLSTIANNIDDMAKLWERFKQAFPKIKRSHPHLCDEQILCILNELSEEGIFKEVIPKDKIEALIGKVDIERKNNLREVASDFKRFEDIAGNKAIRKLFPNFGCCFENILNHNKVEELYLCTTNYDGILDTLLTDPARTNSSGFIFPDGFGRSSVKDHLTLNKRNLDCAKRCMVHLHGSYKFSRIGKATYKVTGNACNNKPVLIFNNPFLKEKEILEDQVLSIYYEKLIEKLKTYDRIIIIGNSFKNEPHIKTLINKHFNRPNTELVICSLNPEEVVRELQSWYKKELHEFTTRGVTTERQLSDLLNQLFNPELVRRTSLVA